ncbi:ATP-grasp domain-containing protein [Streptomyces azureus]|uniref:Biotin carboxylase n=1 Tax=Streptomyces azureus TaxID=146537 RepID=A0A0K8PEH9_STRAJ|nr:biotin carboxylase [Streptomyces azureus]GAP46275.1 biotin carboxylase [Streptomyces azureus]
MTGPHHTGRLTGARPHIVVLHRWRAPYAEYERYVDHRTHAVTYITTDVGATGVPAEAAEIAMVDATDDLAQVRKQLDALASRHGTPRAVVALKEDDLLVAAHLAEERGCRPVRTAAELLRFRDKLVMAQTIADAGLALPAFAPAPDVDAVRDFGARHGWPVIVKPRMGSSSVGVVLVEGPESAERLRFDDADAPLLVQTYDARPVYHVDGVFADRSLGPWRASRYVDSCLGFRAGRALGSVEEDRTEVHDAIGEFAHRVLVALTDRPTVFHLELFVAGGSGGPVECAFLEIGARVGGAEIPFLWREVHGYDLMEAAFRIALGEPPPDRPNPRFAETGGWLLVPAPATRPCVIREAISMVGRAPGPYAEVLLRPGEVLPAADAYYEHVGGRFRFRAGSGAEVEAAVIATARDFEVRGEPCGSMP